MITKDEAKATIAFLADVTGKFISEIVSDTGDIRISLDPTGAISNSGPIITDLADIPEKNLGRGFFLKAMASVSSADQCALVRDWIDGKKTAIPDEFMKQMLENCVIGLARAIPYNYVVDLDLRSCVTDTAEKQIYSIRKRGRVPRFDENTGHRYDWNYKTSRNDDTELMDAMKEVFGKCMEVHRRMWDEDGESLIDAWDERTRAGDCGGKNAIELGLVFHQRKAGDFIRVLFMAAKPRDPHHFMRNLGEDIPEKDLVRAMKEADMTVFRCLAGHDSPKSENRSAFAPA